jgi:hypothetical protein
VFLTYVVMLLIVDLRRFPRFLVDWYGGAPVELSLGALALQWAANV